MNTSYNRSRRGAQRCVLLLASVVGIVFLVFTAVFCSSAEEGEIVRIGWFDSPFYYYDEAGRCTGYAYDYQEKIAAYTGWKYGYVEGSWPELLEELKAGEIDMLCDVSYSADREGKMLFSTLPMGTETYYLFVRADDSKASSGDVSVLNGQRIGVNKGSVQEDYLREWAETNELDIDIVELTESEEHSINMLKSGKIRALVTLDAYGEEDSYVPVAKIGQSDFFFAVNKDHPELLKELNAAMSRIQDEDRYYDQELFEKYIQRSGANAFLNAGESKWLSKHGKVRIGYQNDYLPFCAEDEETGEATGALKEYLDLVKSSLKNADIQFETHPFLTTREALAAMQKGEVDCVFPVNLDAYDSEQMGVLSTTPFMHTEIFAIQKMTDHRGLVADEEKLVAIKEGDQNYEQFLEDYYPDWRMIRYSGDEACFRAVVSGEVDYTPLCNYRIAKMEPLLEKYKVTTVTTGQEMAISFAVRRGETELYGILNKCAHLVSRVTVNSAITKYAYPDVKMSLASVIKDHLAEVILFGVVVVLVGVWLVVRRASDMRRQLEEKLALQDEILQQERKRHQSDAMLTAMASDYRSVYYVDLDRDEGVCYRSGREWGDRLRQGDSFPFQESFRRFADEHVERFDREGFVHFFDPDNIRSGLAKDSVISYRFLSLFSGTEHYEMVRIAAVRGVEDHEGGAVNAISIGFSDVDRETREEMAKNHVLSDALEEAQKANEAKTTFLSSMSHEIRTPMNAIIGLNNIALQDEALPENTRKYLEKMDGSAKHLLSLINDILDMSRIESGSMTIRSEVFSLKDMLEQINTMIGGQCRDKGLDYSCKMDGRVDDHYVGDDMKLKQVLINILGNAVKYTPAPGKVSFVASQKAAYDGNAALRFVIADTGIGMDEKFIPRIFSAFAQEDEKKANKYGSTGLGMAITKHIVDMMNGRIDVESQKGKGSTFVVTVTLKMAEIAGEEPVQNVRKEVEKKDLEGRRILLAEDVEINAEIMKQMLGFRNMDVSHAKDGQAAVDMFRSSEEYEYDAILMDVRMPVMDGLAATEAIRNLDRPDAGTIPIIAMTANAFEEDVERSLQAGMNAHLSKPVEPEKLFETLELLIS